MEFRVLGPLEVVVEGRPVSITSPRQRALLALFLLHANEALAWERIAEALWGEDVPASGAKTVAFHVYRLREALEPDRREGATSAVVATEPAGYVLRLEPDQVDAVRFERLAAEGRARLVDDPAAARQHLAEALALWRGEPYADVAYEAFAQQEIRRLDELRLGALEDRIAADLACGNHGAVVGELERLVGEQPLRERARGQLMLALYRGGRQGDALRVYGEGRRLLSEELGIDPSPELQQLEAAILRQDARLAATGPGPSGPRNPYKGLRPFGEADSADYFGREALVARLLERLALAARAGGLLAVVGPSGSGKSSVVRAGLLPAVRAGALPGSAAWSIAVMLPGAHPFRELRAALAAAGRPLPVRANGRRNGPGDGGRLLAAVVPEGAPRVLLVIDQLEELFALVPDPAERARFLAALAAGLAAGAGRLLAVVTVRADALDALLRSPEVGELVRAGTELVTPLSPGELERAITLPAAAVGVRLEPDLAGRMIGDVARRPGGLPLLQYVLTDLFDRCDGETMTRQGYEALGGVAGTLGRRAEETFAGLDVEHREIARRVFLRLVVAAPTGDPVARRSPRTELHGTDPDPASVDAVIDAFVRSRLLAVDRDAVSGEPTVEIAHEALLERWPRLAAWIEGSREDLWMRRRLTDAAAEWVGAGRDPGYLLAGSRLQLFASWANTTAIDRDAAGVELLEASLAEQQRRDAETAAHAAHERDAEQRARARERGLLAVVAIACTIAVLFGAFAFGRNDATREQEAIAKAQKLAAAAVGSLRADPSLSLLLAVRAVRETAGRGYVVEEAMDAVHWALQESAVAYPTGDVPFAVRWGPDGRRGVPLVPIGELVALAERAAGRTLTDEECRVYLDLVACPATPSTAALRALPVRVGAGVIPMERLAAASLAGTRVDIASALPVDLAPLLMPLVAESGMSVTVGAIADDDLAARLDAGTIPDLAIVAQPRTTASLARQGRLVEMTSMVDMETLRARAGDELVHVATFGADGAWPAAGGLYGAPVAIEASSLVWYPAAAFREAGYIVPTTLAELDELSAVMVADGRTPWCLGLEDEGAAATGTAAQGPAAGPSGPDFVEELVLHEAGLAAYDAWTSGSLGFTNSVVRDAFEHFGRLVLRDERVLTGTGSITEIPRSQAPLPLLLDEPLCWLYAATGSERAAIPAAQTGKLGAFAFPPASGMPAGMLRGRSYEIVVFRDRPEVRRLVEELLGDPFAASATAGFVDAGLWPVGPVDPAYRPDTLAATERDLLARAIAEGSFRVDATDLLPDPVERRFASAILAFVDHGAIGLRQELREIGAAWPRDP